MFRPESPYAITITDNPDRGDFSVWFDVVPDELTEFLFQAMGFIQTRKNRKEFKGSEVKEREFAELMQVCLALGEFPKVIHYSPEGLTGEAGIVSKQFSIASFRYKDPFGKKQKREVLIFERKKGRRIGYAGVLAHTLFRVGKGSFSVSERANQTEAYEAIKNRSVQTKIQHPFGFFDNEKHLLNATSNFKNTVKIDELAIPKNDQNSKAAITNELDKMVAKEKDVSQVEGTHPKRVSPSEGTQMKPVTPHAETHAESMIQDGGTQTMSVFPHQETPIKGVSPIDENTIHIEEEYSTKNDALPEPKAHPNSDTLIEGNMPLSEEVKIHVLPHEGIRPITVSPQEGTHMKPVTLLTETQSESAVQDGGTQTMSVFPHQETPIKSVSLDEVTKGEYSTESQEEKDTEEELKTEKMMQSEQRDQMQNQQNNHFEILSKLLPELLEHINRGVRYSESFSPSSRYSKIEFNVLSESVENLIDVSLEFIPRDKKNGSKPTLELRLNQSKEFGTITNSHLKNDEGELLRHSDFNPLDFKPLIEEMLRDGHLFALSEEEAEIVENPTLENTEMDETKSNEFSPIQRILLTAKVAEEFYSWDAANEWLKKQIKQPGQEHRIYYSIKWQNGDELVAYFELFADGFHPQFQAELLQKVVIRHLLKNHYAQENRFNELGGKKAKRKEGFYKNLMDAIDLGSLRQHYIANYQPKIPVVSVEVITKIIITENKYESIRKFGLANEFLSILKNHGDSNELIELKVVWKDETSLSTSVKLKSIPKSPTSTFWKTLLKSKTEIEEVNPYQFDDDEPLLLDAEIAFEAPAFYYQGLENAYWHDTDTDLTQKIHFSGYSYHLNYLSEVLQGFLNNLSDEEENEAIELANKYPKQQVVLQFILEFKKLETDDFNLQLAMVKMLIEKAVIKQDENSKTALYGLLLKFQNDGILVSLPNSRIQEKKEHTKPSKESNRIKQNREIEAIINKKGNSLTLYSYEDFELMKQYSGYGGSKVSEVNRGLLYEYYTPDEIIKYMWGFAIKHGYTSGAVLEPSCGIGKFLAYAPKDVRIEGYETNEYSAQIAKLLYPNATIHHKSFESLFFNGNVYLKGQFRTDPFDLVIGNPPYGSFIGKYAGMGEKKRTKAFTYDQYFLSRGLDVLNSNGLLIMVIPQSFLDNDSKYNALKENIYEKAEFIEARRLPHGIFQHTEVGTDIVVFRKK